jgi:WD40 repeat protein
MAPEQADGSKVGPRADLYSLGATLHYLLVGSPPFEGSSVEVMKHLVIDKPARLRSRRADVPRALDALVARLLEKAPDARPASATEVALELEAIADGVEESRSPRMLVWAALGVGLLAAGAIALAMHGATPQPPPPPTETPEASPKPKATPTPTPSPKDPPTPATPAPPPPPSAEERLARRYAALLRSSAAPLRVAKVAGRDEPGHAGGVRALGWGGSPSKSRVYSGGWTEPYLRVWDPDTGMEVGNARLEGAVRSIALTPDGRRAAVGTSNGQIYRLDLEGDTPRQLPLMRPQELGRGDVAVAISDDGEMVLAAAGPTVWSCPGSGDPIAVGSLSPKNAWWVRFAWDGKHAFAGSDDGLAVLDLSERRMVHSYPDHHDTVIAGELGDGPRGRFLATLGNDGTVLTWQLDDSTGKLVRCDEWRDPHPEAQTAKGSYGLATLANGRVLSTSACGNVHVWEPGRAEPTSFPACGLISKLGPPVPWTIFCAAASPHGRRVAVGSADGAIRFFELAGPSPGLELRTSPGVSLGFHRASVRSIAVSPDGGELLTAGDDGTARFWTRDLTSKGSYTLGIGSLVGARYLRSHEHPKRIVALGLRGELLLWEPESGETRAIDRKPVAIGQGGSLEVSADGGRVLAVGGWQGEPALFEAGPEGLSRVAFKGFSANMGALSAGGGYFALSNGGLPNGRQFAGLWDARTLQGPFAIPPGGFGNSWVEAVKFLGDDLVLATQDDSRIERWAVAPPRNIWTQQGAYGVRALEVSTRAIALAYPDGPLVIRDSGNGAEIGRLHLEAAADCVTALAFEEARSGELDLWVGTGRGALLKVEISR